MFVNKIEWSIEAGHWHRLNTEISIFGFPAKAYYHSNTNRHGSDVTRLVATEHVPNKQSLQEFLSSDTFHCVFSLTADF